MDIRKLQKVVVTALEDIKGMDIEVLNTTKLTSLFDRVVVATGSSNRQVKSLARNVHDKVKEAGGDVRGIEGEESGEWVLVDLGDIVVHVMQPAIRAYYNLEELLATKPARLSRVTEAESTASPVPEKKVAAKPKPAAEKKPKAAPTVEKKPRAKPAAPRRKAE